MLFSHQQPFSRLDAQGPKLQKALKRLLDDRRITAWYWGHEHECVDLRPASGVGAARPLPRQRRHSLGPQEGGDGARRPTAIPAAAAARGSGSTATADSPGCIVLDGPNADMKKTADKKKFVPHGFMTLEFNGPKLIERVFLSNGTEIYSNTIG